MPTLTVGMGVGKGQHSPTSTLLYSGVGLGSQIPFNSEEIRVCACRSPMEGSTVRALVGNSVTGQCSSSARKHRISMRTETGLNPSSAASRWCESRRGFSRVPRIFPQQEGGSIPSAEGSSKNLVHTICKPLVNISNLLILFLQIYFKQM